MTPPSRPILWWLLLALAAQPLSAASALETSVLRPAGLEESSPDTKREFRTALGGPALPPSLNGTGGLEEPPVMDPRLFEGITRQGLAAFRRWAKTHRTLVVDVGETVLEPRNPRAWPERRGKIEGTLSRLLGVPVTLSTFLEPLDLSGRTDTDVLRIVRGPRRDVSGWTVILADHFGGETIHDIALVPLILRGACRVSQVTTVDAKPYLALQAEEDQAFSAALRQITARVTPLLPKAGLEEDQGSALLHSPGVRPEVLQAFIQLVYGEGRFSETHGRYGFSLGEVNNLLAETAHPSPEELAILHSARGHYGILYREDVWHEGPHEQPTYADVTAEIAWLEQARESAVWQAWPMDRMRVMLWLDLAIAYALRARCHQSLDGRLSDMHHAEVFLEQSRQLAGRIVVPPPLSQELERRAAEIAQQAQALPAAIDAIRPLVAQPETAGALLTVIALGPSVLDEMNSFGQARLLELINLARQEKSLRIVAVWHSRPARGQLIEDLKQLNATTPIDVSAYGVGGDDWLEEFSDALVSEGIKVQRVEAKVNRLEILLRQIYADLMQVRASRVPLTEIRRVISALDYLA